MYEPRLVILFKLYINSVHIVLIDLMKGKLPQPHGLLGKKKKKKEKKILWNKPISSF